MAAKEIFVKKAYFWEQEAGRWRASKAHSGGEGPRHCPAPGAAYRAEAECVVCDLLCWLSFKSWLRRPWRGLNRAGDRPDEAYHLACDGDIDDIGGLAARPQPTISGAEPDLHFPADVANDFWQRLDPVNLVTADA